MLKFRLGFPPFLVRSGSESCPFQKFSRYLRMVRSMKQRATRAGGVSQPIIFNQSFDMAKGNMLLGFSRGSVGDLTFYRRNSQQVTRARARVVKNPKTLAQQMQRAIMRTSVEAYKVIKEICDHSWEGVAYGANSYAEFQKQNMAMLRRLAAAGGENTKSFVPSGFNGLVAMPWVLSKGSIAWGGVECNFGQGQAALNIVFNGMPAESEIANISYQGFCDFLNLQAGDQLTLVAFPKRRDIDESSCIEPIISRVILSPVDGDMDDSLFEEGTGHINPMVANPLNENAGAFNFRVQTGKLMASLFVPSGEEQGIVGAAAIISRRASNGSWLRSTAIMAVSENEKEGGYSLRQASMVVSTEITTPSDWYLNNANEVSE